jgi:capsular polysaccharide biosynthesis protein
VLVSRSGAVFMPNGSLLYESVFPWQVENMTQQFGSAIRLSEGHVSAAFDASHPVTHVETAFLAREGGEVGYFHFINSILPRIALLHRIGSSQPLPVYASRRERFADEMLSMLGQPTEPLPPGWIKAKRLFFPSPFILEGDHFTRPRYGSTLLKELLNPLLGKPVAPRRKLYLSRDDAVVRRVTNQAELDGVLASYGFESVCAAGMTMRDQIDLFRSCSWLVSAHGAGLSNMVFMPPGSVITEMVSPARLWPTFRTLAARHGHVYHAVIGRAVDGGQTPEKGQGNEDFCCDPKALRLSLEQAQYAA